MNTIISQLRDIIGVPEFYINNGNYNSTWDYGAMLEYMIAGVIVCIVISSVFKFIRMLLQ